MSGCRYATASRRGSEASSGALTRRPVARVKFPVRRDGRYCAGEVGSTAQVALRCGCPRDGGQMTVNTGRDGRDVVERRTSKSRKGRAGVPRRRSACTLNDLVVGVRGRPPNAPRRPLNPTSSRATAPYSRRTLLVGGSPPPTQRRSARFGARARLKPMKTGRSTADGRPSRGLRTGKIRTSKSSASEIRRSVGVKPSEAKVASRALIMATRSSTTGKFIVAKKDKPRTTKGGATTKKR